MATVVFSHGDKGGSGKSTTAAALVDYCISIDRPVALIEGDEKTPDVGLRYLDHIPTGHVDLNSPGNKEEAAIEFLGKVDEMTSGEVDTVIVNLPANASATLDDVGEILVMTLNDAGHECRVIYALGEQKAATEGIKQSIKSGLLSRLPKDNITIAYNKNLGDPQHWDYVVSGTRQKIGTGYNEFIIPELKPPRLAQKVFATKYESPFFELGQKDNPELTLSETNFFNHGWLRPMYKQMAQVLPAKEDASDG